jgi:hypothetical protein
MNKNLCSNIECPNHGKYARICGHLQDEEKELKQDTKQYLKVRADFLKAHPTCEVGTCTKKATDIHHKCGRRKKYLSNPKYFLAVCRGHHLFIESHPIWARENGYSLSRLSTENKTI